MGDYQLTPYDILGIQENARLGDIHCAYRNLIRLVHPDKNMRIHRRLGWSDDDCSEAFHRIRKAYKTLLKQKKIALKDAPMENVDYDIEDDFIIIEDYEKERAFDVEAFNQKFEQLKKHYDEENPNSVGYSEFSHGSGAFSESADAGDFPVQPSLGLTFPEPFSVPSGCDKPVCHEFGLTTVEDFSIHSSEKGNMLEGTDLIKAFQEISEPKEIVAETKSLEKLLEERKRQRQETIEFDDKEQDEAKKKEERKQQLKWNVLQKRDTKLAKMSLITNNVPLEPSVKFVLSPQ